MLKKIEKKNAEGETQIIMLTNTEAEFSFPYLRKNYSVKVTTL